MLPAPAPARHTYSDGVALPCHIFSHIQYVCTRLLYFFYTNTILHHPGPSKNHASTTSPQPSYPPRPLRARPWPLSPPFPADPSVSRPVQKTTPSS